MGDFRSEKNEGVLAPLPSPTGTPVTKYESRDCTLRCADPQSLIRALYEARGASFDSEDVALSALCRPDGMLNVYQAAERLIEAIKAGSVIGVATDFDCDGATAGAIAVIGLGMLGAAKVIPLVPDRKTMGYGLSPALAGIAADRGVKLLITADNGISAFAGVEAAKRLGMEVIVTDHHLPGERLPNADFIVNPNQEGCDFPSKALCGAGVLYYVMLVARGMMARAGIFAAKIPRLEVLADLVAIATVADLVPLDRNNRTLVRAGLSAMQRGQAQPGVQALADAVGVDLAFAKASDIGFKLGPAINAAGRINHMDLGIATLSSPSISEARESAITLHDINQERRRLTRESVDVAINMPEVSGGTFGLAVYDPTWEEGVVGLVASRLKEQFHRPACALTDGSTVGHVKGSCRSISGLHIRDVVALVDAMRPGAVVSYGGHSMAAGLTLNAEHLDQFMEAFDAAARKLAPPGAEHRVVVIDGELPDDLITLQCAEAIEAAGPWGQGLEEPLFSGSFNVIKAEVMGADRSHARYSLEVGDRAVAAVHFSGAEVLQHNEISCTYQLAVNRWRGRCSLQLIIRDLL